MNHLEDQTLAGACGGAESLSLLEIAGFIAVGYLIYRAFRPKIARTLKAAA